MSSSNSWSGCRLAQSLSFFQATTGSGQHSECAVLCLGTVDSTMDPPMSMHWESAQSHQNCASIDHGNVINSGWDWVYSTRQVWRHNGLFPSNTRQQGQKAPLAWRRFNPSEECTCRIAGGHWPSFTHFELSLAHPNTLVSASGNLKLVIKLFSTTGKKISIIPEDKPTDSRLDYAPVWTRHATARPIEEKIKEVYGGKEVP